ALSAAGVPTVTHAEDLPLHLQPAVAPFLLLLRSPPEPETLDEESAVALLHSPLGGADPLAERRLRQGLRALALAAGGRRASRGVARRCGGAPGATGEQVVWRVWRASGLADRWYAMSTRGAPVEPGGEGGRARQWRGRGGRRPRGAIGGVFVRAPPLRGPAPR